MNNKTHNPNSRPTIRPAILQSGAVYFLFVAWLAFTLTTTLQHCCKVLVATPTHQTQVASLAPSSHDGAVNHHDSEEENNDHCQQLVSINAIASGQSTLPGYAGTVFAVAIHAAASLTTIAFVPSVKLLLSTPPPPPRLYLSTQRLRI